MKAYQGLSDEKLLDLLFTEGDRLPLEAIDEFINRGEKMTKPLADIVSERYSWVREVPEWWAVVHAAYILGTIGGRKTILPLLKSLRFAAAYDCDWVIEELPSIFGKIGIMIIDDLKTIARDRTTDWYTRSFAMDGLAAITIDNPAVEEDIFPFIHSILKDNEEDREVRQTAGHVLLDFLRSEYKEDILIFGREEAALKDKDINYISSFHEDDVKDTFAKGEKSLRLYTKDWLSFYNEEEIRKRQERWKKEAEESEEDTCEEDDWDKPADYSLKEPFVRDIPKIGRNTPCPCGSGNKYKKCCIDKPGMTWN